MEQIWGGLVGDDKSTCSLVSGLTTIQRVKRHGTYKISNRPRATESPKPSAAKNERRVQRILESLRREILNGKEQKALNIRKIASEPKELYRIEIELPDLEYQRVTLIEEDILEELLADDDIRSRISIDRS